MRRGRLGIGVGCATLLAVLALTGAAAEAADPGPELHLSAPTAQLGGAEVVTGTGFTRGAQVQIEICGIGGSSNACNLQDAIPATADANGGFTVHLKVTEPPTPCPCTVHAAPFAGTASAPVDAPIQIPGLRFLPDAAPVVSGVAHLLDATAAEDSSPLAQIGGQGSVRVTLTFADLSGGPAADPGIALVLTRGTHTVGRYPVRWTGGDLAVGQRRSLVYEVPLPGGWFRDFGIAVVLGRAADGHQVTARTLAASVRPWGELLAPAALLLGVLLVVLTRRRRSTEQSTADGNPADETSAEGLAGVEEPEDSETDEPAGAVGGLMSEDESPAPATPGGPGEP
jgi:hypothetical protein